MSYYNKTLLFSGSNNNNIPLTDSMNNYERIGVVYSIPQNNSELSVTSITSTSYTSNLPCTYCTNSSAKVFGTVCWVDTVYDRILLNNGSSTCIDLTGTATAVNYGRPDQTVIAVYGYDKVNNPNISGMGSPGAGWTRYDETVIWSSQNPYPYGTGTKTLFEPASSFERIRFYAGAYSPYAMTQNTVEINAPKEDNWLFCYDFTTAEYNTQTSRGYVSGIFKEGTTKMGINGKYYLGTEFTTGGGKPKNLGLYTISKVVGINRKS